jgi:hypothetical protein
MRRWATDWAGALECGGDALQLLQVIDVVAGHGFDDGPEGHGAAFGMRGWALAVGVGDGCEEFEVPVTGGLKEDDGGGEVVGGVALSPGVLIEGLDGWMGFAEGLAKAEAEDDFAIGKVRDDFADAPLAGGWRLIELGLGERREELMEVAGGGFEDGERLLGVEKFCVGIEVHGETVSR